jgi:hypothetical protein
LKGSENASPPRWFNSRSRGDSAGFDVVNGNGLY